jgi:hypothetical protein
MDDAKEYKVLFQWYKPNIEYAIGWDKKDENLIIGRDNNDIINVDIIIWEWKLHTNAKVY